MFPQSHSAKRLPKARPQSCQACPRNLFPKAVSKSCFLKLLPKAVVLQSNCPSMLLQCRKIAPHSCSPTSESCSPKYLRKAVAPKRLCFKPVPQSYSPKRLRKAAPQSCSPKLRFFKAAVQSCSSKLLPKAAPQSCSPALLHKVVPKAVLQSCCPKAAESCCPKLPAGLESCPKLFPKTATQSFPGAAPQSCAQSCSPKLLP